MPKKKISWQPGYSLSRKPAKKPRSSTRRTNSARTSEQGGLQQFEFVAEYPVRHAGDSTSTRSPIGILTNPDPSLEPCVFNDCQLQADSGWVVPDDFNHETSKNPSSQVAAIELYSAAISDYPIMTCSLSSSVPPNIQYNSLSQRFRPILDRYNKEFCIIPLTFDLRMNPFRYRIDLDPEPKFLVHAVVALAGHHVESESTQDHHHLALQLLRKNLDLYESSKAIYSMLDAIVILFSLDETQSAFGNWTTHFLGAYAILEASGGVENFVNSVRVRAQVALLTWWDAITSLVSREDCIFPHSYFEAAQLNNSGSKWDYFGLCGCPLSLVEIVMQLARLSSEKQKSSSMIHATFDNTVVTELQHSLESWYHVSLPTAFESEESMQEDRDRMHCSEAWRNGLVLYIYRVFFWEPGNNVPMGILHLARVVVDHVFACRDESMVARQALLPLFFAGCELRDPSTRKKILESCLIWNERTKYHMFLSAMPLLKEVWAEGEAKGFENVWWGQVVDKQHKAESCSPLQMRLCFG